MAATDELWNEVIKAMQLFPLPVCEITAGKFKFFMEFTIRDYEPDTDVLVCQRVFDAFEKIEQIDNLFTCSRKVALTVATFTSICTERHCRKLNSTNLTQLSLRFPHLEVTQHMAIILRDSIKSAFEFHTCVDDQKKCSTRDRSRSPRDKRFQVRHLLTCWDHEIYDGEIRLPVPYSDLDSVVRNDRMTFIQKDHGVGFELGGKLTKCTHFERSHKGIWHYSMNSASIQKMNKLVLSSFNQKNPLFFNEMIIGERFCLFFECDSKPIHKTGVYFARLIIQGLLYKVIQNPDFPQFTDTSVLKCVILSASNSKKTSYHIRFPDIQVCQEDALSIVSLVKKFIKDVDVSNSIDLTPIEKALVQLRLPFSDKPDKSQVGPAGRPLDCIGILAYQDSLKPATNADVLRLCSLHAKGLTKIETCSTYMSCKRHYSGSFQFSKILLADDDGANVREDINRLRKETEKISEKKYREWIDMATNRVCTP